VLGERERTRSAGKFRRDRFTFSRGGKWKKNDRSSLISDKSTLPRVFSAPISRIPERSGWRSSHRASPIAVAVLVSDLGGKRTSGSASPIRFDVNLKRDEAGPKLMNRAFRSLDAAAHMLNGDPRKRRRRGWSSGTILIRSSTLYIAAGTSASRSRASRTARSLIPRASLRAYKRY